MELIFAFILSVIGVVLIYQYGDLCAIKKRRVFDRGVILAVCDFLVAGMWIGAFLKG